MIELEWRVHTLQQRGLPMEAMDRDDQLAVLTHYYKRHAGVDGTTSEPATVKDLISVQAALHGKLKPESDAQAEGLRRLQERAGRGH